MINILYLHAGSEMYGADKVLLELVAGLDKKEFHPIIILPSEGVLAVALRQQNIEVHIVAYPILRRKYFNIQGIIKYSNGYFKATNQIYELVKNRDIKLLHINTVAVLEGIALKKKLNVPLIWHVHEIITTPKIVYKVTSSLLGKYANQIIAVSEAVKQHLIDSGRVSEEKIKVIYNGVDNRVFNPNVRIDYLFDEFKIPINSVRVGMIGRVNAWKGQMDFLKATSPLLEEFPKLYLFLIGGVFKGEEQRLVDLKEFVAGLPYQDRIIISDFRNDTPNLHNFFDVFVLPSTRPDPLPTVVLEAMATGKPIVGYSHGGITEMVEQDSNGLLAQPNQTNLLGNQIQKMISDSEQRQLMGNNSLFRQKKYFSLFSYIKGFQCMYKNILKG